MSYRLVLWEQPRWRRRVLFVILGILISVALGASLQISRSVVLKLGELSTSRFDNAYWTVTRLDVEFLEFRNSLITAVAAEAAEAGNISGEDNLTLPLANVRVRYDILFSRFTTLLESRIYREALSAAGSLETVEESFLAVRKVMPAIDAPDQVLFESLPDILAMTGEMRGAIRRTAMESNSLLAVRSEQGRNEISQLLVQLAVGIMALVGLMAVLAIVLYRLYQVARTQGQEARRASDRFGTILDTSPDGLVVTNEKGAITDMNPAASELLGRSFDEARDTPIGTYVTRRDTDEPFHLPADVTTSDHFEVTIHRPNAAPIPADLSVGFRADHVKPVAVYFFRNVSDRIAAEQELRLSRDEALAGQRAKSHFMAVMSHEMRTPLNGILGVAELLKASKLDALQAAQLEILEQSGQLLLHHVNNILDIARFEAKGVVSAKTTFDLETLSRDLMQSLTPQAQLHGNTLSLQIDSSALGRFRGDAARLRQILTNLLGNAVKFTQDGEVNLEVSAQGVSDTQVEFQVIDTGRAIAAEHIEQVFEDFYRVASPDERAVEGTGLGLGIVRRLVEAMQGSFGVESEEGEGSLFWVRLPLERAGPVGVDGGETVAAQPEAEPVDQAPRHILVAEDNPVNRLVLRQILEREGHTVVEARDGFEAVEIAEKTAFDLILMDIQMPRCDGTEATKTIRAGQGASARVPIFALTAHAFPEERHRFLAAGFDEVLTKPVNIARLRRVMSDVPDDTTTRPSGPSRQAELPLLNSGHLKELRFAIGEEAVARALDGLRAQAAELRSALESAPSRVEANEIHALSGLAATCGAEQLHAALKTAETKRRSGGSIASEELIGLIQATTAEITSRQPQLS